MKYLTNREIHVLGIQRTGQHAVASWLIGHFDKVCYRNSMSQIGEKAKNTKGVEPPWWYFKSNCETWQVSNDDSIDMGVDAIILGTEITFDKVGLNPRIDEQKRQMAIKCGVNGFSEKQNYVMVIRNPFNHYASVLKWSRNRRLGDPVSFAAAWIAMAKEVLGETNNIPNPKTIVIYDKWFADIEERRKISELLDLKFNDSRLSIVMKIGVDRQYGSSFDGMNKQNGQEMDVLNRWKCVKDNSNFKALRDNKQIIEYSEKLGFETI